SRVAAAGVQRDCDLCYQTHPNPPPVAVTKYRSSAAQTLSLASTAIVASVLAVSLAVVWATMTRSTLRNARVGLNRSVRQLVVVSANSIRMGELRFARV